MSNSKELTDFLLARIAEEEKLAHSIGVNVGLSWAYTDATATPQPLLYVAPGRVLAECEVKRRIITQHLGGETEELTYAMLKVIALPYSGHPDYNRAEWGDF